VSNKDAKLAKNWYDVLWQNTWIFFFKWSTEKCC